MKFKSKYLIIMLTLFVSFIGINRVNASEISLKPQDLFVLLDNEDDNTNFSDRGNGTRGNGTTGGGISDSRGNGFKEGSGGISSNDSNGGSWCSNFNQVWYIFGIIIQVIYVATPLLLIVSGSITMIQAMMKNDSGAVKKAQGALVNKVIAAVVVFLMVSIVKMVTNLVADDGWTSCANCAFNPSYSNCGIEKQHTGE